MRLQIKCLPCSELMGWSTLIVSGRNHFSLASVYWHVTAIHGHMCLSTGDATEGGGVEEDTAQSSRSIPELKAEVPDEHVATWFLEAVHLRETKENATPPPLDSVHSVHIVPGSHQLHPRHLFFFFFLGIYSKGIIWNTEIPSNTNDHNSEVYKSKNVEKTSMPYRWGWSKWRWNSIMWQKVHKFCARATGVWTLLWYKLHTLAKLLHLSFSVKRPLPLEAVQMKMEITSQQGPGQPPPNKDNCLPYPLPRFISVI